MRAADAARELHRAATLALLTTLLDFTEAGEIAAVSEEDVAAR